MMNPLADHLLSFVLQTGSCLIGLLVGTLVALAIDRRKEQRHNRVKARIILRSLQQELEQNHHTLAQARPAFRTTPWGKSFYVCTSTWETALAADLPSIVGFGLTDSLAEQYGSLQRVRHFLDLLTNLWMAPRDIEGYQSMQQGFHAAICTAMDEAMDHHAAVMTKIAVALGDAPLSRSRERNRRLVQEYAVSQ